LKQPEANTLALTARVDQVLDEVGKSLPKGLTINRKIFRQSDFISVAMDNVAKALRDGAILVALILIIFLMNARATIISLTAIPLSLVITTLAIVGITAKEVRDSYELSLQAAREMGQAGVNLVVLGGVPINVSRGFGKVEDLVESTQKTCGVPVTTSLNARIDAFSRLNSRRVAVVGLSDDPGEYLGQIGLQVVACKGVGCTPPDWDRVPSETSVQVARELIHQHPEADTLYFPCAHRATLDKIEAMEQELGVNVVTASQSIIWHALRRCGIHDSIPGYGRLFREP
jgi:maleate cis-trans isomerase